MENHVRDSSLQHFRRGWLTGALLFAGVMLSPAAAAQPAKLRVILVGDSTMAPRTGYGDALCRLLGPAVVCLNLAKGGRSSASYRSEGLWDTVLELLAPDGMAAGGAPAGRAYRRTYVLIQFGHNDQPGKPGRSTDLVTGFPVNLGRYVDEVIGAGAGVVLVTPLSRRNFREGRLDNDLAPWAEAVRRVAAARRVPLLDLNSDSAEAIAAMGPAQADSLAMAPPGSAPTSPPGGGTAGFDHTHLGARGADLFARMVARALARAVPPLAAPLAASPEAERARP